MVFTFSRCQQQQQQQQHLIKPATDIVEIHESRKVTDTGGQSDLMPFFIVIFNPNTRKGAR